VITFRETIDSVERLNESMKAADEIRTAIDHCMAYLADLGGMLEYSHTKNFRDVGEALEYVDKVLVPRLNRIRDALASESEPPLKRLDVARDLTTRLLLRLRMFSEQPGEGLLP
jgi:hypothetical protein